MGQANQRGTSAERILQATAGSEKLSEMIKNGTAPHYAFILDKSKNGLDLLKQLKKGPEEIQARVKTASVQLWEMAHFEFLVLWGTWGMSGGLHMQVLDMNQLLSEAIPKAIERTQEKGGLCTFLPGVDEKYQEKIVARIAELEPGPASNSNKFTH